MGRKGHELVVMAWHITGAGINYRQIITFGRRRGPGWRVHACAYCDRSVHPLRVCAPVYSACGLSCLLLLCLLRQQTDHPCGCARPPLSSFCAQMDVEGFEHHVLRGSEAFFKAQTVWFMLWVVGAGRGCHIDLPPQPCPAEPCAPRVCRQAGIQLCHDPVRRPGWAAPQRATAAHHKVSCSLLFLSR